MFVTICGVELIIANIIIYKNKTYAIVLLLNPKNCISCQQKIKRQKEPTLDFSESNKFSYIGEKIK